MAAQLQFGYYPDDLDFKIGELTVSTLDGLEAKVHEVNASGLIEGDWYYSPPAASKDFGSGVVRQLPYQRRVFGLPKTHVLDHSSATDPEQVRFLIWVLGFVLGMRLSDTEAGFLDATPIKPGTLTDMVWLGRSESKAIAIADAFWRTHAANPRISKGVTGIIHSLFLSQTPTLLGFEEFMYLYIALDGCHAVWSGVNSQPPKMMGHSKRIANLCTAFNCPIPDWADPKTGSVVAHRNKTLHEGLFFDEPLGFRTYSGNSGAAHRNVLLEMACLVSRLLCGLLGFNDVSYITSPVDTRQRHGVKL